MLPESEHRNPSLISKPRNRKVFRRKLTEKCIDSAKALYQARKYLAKTVKVVRGLLVQKIGRRLTALKDEDADESKLSTELQSLNKIKSVDHISVANKIVDNHLLNLSTDNFNIHDIENSIVKHPRIVAAIAHWKCILEKAVIDENEKKKLDHVGKSDRRSIQV